MIAVDVRLCDSTSSDLTDQKHTEVVLVLPPHNSDKPKRCLPYLPIFVPVVTLVQVRMLSLSFLLQAGLLLTHWGLFHETVEQLRIEELRRAPIG